MKRVGSYLERERECLRDLRRVKVSEHGLRERIGGNVSQSEREERFWERKSEL